MKIEGQVRIPSGCAISAVISKDGNKMSGEIITNSMIPMHDRSNGLGGGFADPGNIEGTLVADGELVVENVTPFNPGYETANSGSGLAGLIEYGDGYQGHTYDYYPKNKPATYAEPRPFMEDTRDIVKRGLKHTIATALEDRGLEVKI